MAHGRYRCARREGHGMRGVWSTSSGKVTIAALLIVVAVVFMSGRAHEERVLRLQGASAIERPALMERLADDVWRWHGAIGLTVIISIGLIGAIAVRVEQRLGKASTSLDETAGHLHEMSLSRTSFLSMMSHELRTPLNSIIGFSGILSSGMAGELSMEQRKQLGIINSAGKQLLYLINDILDLSKLETGKLVLVAEEFPVLSVVDTVNDTLRPLAEERGLEIRVRASDPGIKMCTDRRRLEQVLLALISRSIRTTEIGHVLVEIGASGGGDITFTVSDTSSGLTAEEVAALFEEQGDAGTRSARARSTGFALVVSRRLARALGGDIVAESEPGLGSMFTLTLPDVVDKELCA